MHDEEFNYKALKRGFIAGWEACERLKALEELTQMGDGVWINAEEYTPSHDRTVVVYERNLDTPWWGKLALGAYIAGKWYLAGGTAERFQITRWMEIPTHTGGIKTLDEWNEIFGRKIETDKKELTEKQYTLEAFKVEVK